MMEERMENLQEKEEGRGSFSSLLKGILIGGLIGAGVALLSAPRSGEESRELLREKGIELRDKVEETRSRAEDMARKATDRITQTTQQGQDTLNEQKVNLESAVEGVKEGVRTYVELNQQGLTDDSQTNA